MTEPKTSPTTVVPARKSRQVSTAVPAEYFDGLEDFRWTARLKLSDVVRAALDEYVDNHGIKVDGTAPVAQ